MHCTRHKQLLLFSWQVRGPKGNINIFFLSFYIILNIFLYSISSSSFISFYIFLGKEGDVRERETRGRQEGYLADFDKTHFRIVPSSGVVL